MRILTRSDFDGIVCAALLKDALNIHTPISWVEPNDMQKGYIDVQSEDILANLPFHKNCRMWFDHHYTNQIDQPFEGKFQIAPSAAGLIFDYFQGKFHRDFTEVVTQADKIDSADLTPEEVQYPEHHPWLLLSMTLFPGFKEDEPYWNKLVDLIRTSTIDQIMSDPMVRPRCAETVRRNARYARLLKQYTTVKAHVSITDFRQLENAPTGNRFLVYSIFPDTVVNVRIRKDRHDPEKINVSIGHSIFNRGCRVNAGLLLSRFEGGGHPGAASCRFHASRADVYIPAIIDALMKNEPIES